MTGNAMTIVFSLLLLTGLRHLFSFLLLGKKLQRKGFTDLARPQHFSN